MHALTFLLGERDKCGLETRRKVQSCHCCIGFVNEVAVYLLVIFIYFVSFMVLHHSIFNHRNSLPYVILSWNSLNTLKYAVHIHFAWRLACMLAIICLHTSICLHIHLAFSNLCVQLYVSCTMKHYRNTKSYYMKASVNILWCLQCRMMCRVQIGTFIPHLANIPQDVYWNFNAKADVWTCKTISFPVVRMVCM